MDLLDDDYDDDNDFGSSSSSSSSDAGDPSDQTEKKASFMRTFVISSIVAILIVLVLATQDILKLIAKKFGSAFVEKNRLESGRSVYRATKLTNIIETIAVQFASASVGVLVSHGFL